MRSAALLLVALLAGCTLLERTPPVVVKNETTRDITGEVLLHDANATGEPRAKWGFHVPGLAFREVARLPRDFEDGRVTIVVDDGPTRTARADDQGTLLLRVGETGIMVS